MKPSSEVCLTKRQLEILDFLVEYRQKHRVSPTLAEIADHFKISKVTVFEHLRALKRRRAIRLSRRTPRSAAPIVDRGRGGSSAEIEPAVPVHLEVLGAVAAGSPVESFDAPETFDFDSLVGDPGRRFLLKVTGQSMLDEHIADGDLILVESRASAENGETVVAMIDGGATVKKFYREGSPPRVRLQPANPTLPPIYPDACEIKGVVVGLIRRL